MKIKRNTNINNENNFQFLARQLFLSWSQNSWGSSSSSILNALFDLETVFLGRTGRNWTNVITVTLKKKFKWLDPLLLSSSIHLFRFLWSLTVSHTVMEVNLLPGSLTSSRLTSYCKNSESFFNCFCAVTYCVLCTLN